MLNYQKLCMSKKKPLVLFYNLVKLEKNIPVEKYMKVFEIAKMACEESVAFQ